MIPFHSQILTLFLLLSTILFNCCYCIPRHILSRRIVGGRHSRVEDSLHQVSLQTTDGAHFCGGAIIADCWIVSAAHCLIGLSPSSLQIRYNTLRYNSGGYLAAVSTLITHEEFDSVTNDNDIALLQTSSKLNIAPLSIVRLPQPEVDPPEDSLVTVYGWGYSDENSTHLTRNLQSVIVSVAPKEACTGIYGDAITENMFCAGEPEGGKDACKGDSGGPAVDEDGTLVGLVSWGFACARPMFPGIYTKVANYVEWILEQGVTLNY